MEPRLTFLTLGVKNLENMKRFYSDCFGWTPIKDSDGIVFFKLNGIILSLFPAEELAEDIGCTYNEVAFKGFTCAVNYSSEEEVNKVFETLSRKGAHIQKLPVKVSWGGYSGYISDPEGNFWEIAHNPFLQMDAGGNAVSHD